ncbi:MAG TPA: M23 family metallopeptidase [Micromonosporaceae bacterium]
MTGPSPDRVASHRRFGRRWPARWYLAAAALLLVSGIVAGVVLERDEPWRATGAQPSGWPGAQAPWPVSTPTSAAAGPGSTSANPSGAPASPSAGAGGGATYVFPVAGTVSYARTHHDYPASDIIAACGSAVRAVTDGYVLEVSRVDTYDPSIDDGAARGGLFVSVAGDDGVRYYGSHLRSVAPGIEAGRRVRAGATLGEVGASGHAGVCHLHFGISPPCARTGDWWVRRGSIWPWSFLDSWRRGEARSPAAQVRAWNRANGCPGAPR